jgi:hypothetical protein
MKGGAALSVGIDHPACTVKIAAVDAATRDALAADLA